MMNLAHILSGTTPLNLFRLLRDNQFRVHFAQYPRLILVILMNVLNTPFVLLENRIYGKRIRSTKVIQPIFILGYPRSGTTHLIYQLSRDAQFGWCKTYECMSPHVMLLLGPFLRWVSRIALPKKRPMDNMPMGPDLPAEEEFAMANMGLASMTHGLYFPRQFTAYTQRFALFGDEAMKAEWKRNHLFLLQKLTYKNKGRQLILKSPFDTARIPEILELYPDARFIHIVRNPLDVYSSNKRLYQKILPQLALQNISDQHMEEHIQQTYKLVFDRFHKHFPLLDDSQRYQIKYEDFIGHEPKVIQAIYRHFNLGEANMIAESSGHAKNGPDQYKKNQYTLTREEEQMIAREWASSFQIFEYDMLTR